METIDERVEGTRLDELVASADVVLDGCDNFATRHAVNRACVKHGKPLVSGAGVRFDGQISVFDMRRDDAPCYACLFPEDAQGEEVRCAVMGVFAPLTGIIGCLQAAEALKVLTGAGDKAFVSGADISQFEDLRAAREAVERYEVLAETALTAIQHCPVPTLTGRERRV